MDALKARIAQVDDRFLLFLNGKTLRMMEPPPQVAENIQQSNLSPMLNANEHTCFMLLSCYTPCGNTWFCPIDAPEAQCVPYLEKGMLPYNRRTNVELSFVLSGHLDLVTLGEPLTLRAGDVYIRNCSCVHCDQTVSSDGLVVYLSVSPDFLRRWLRPSYLADSRVMGFLNTCLDHEDQTQRYVRLTPRSDTAAAPVAALMHQMAEECLRKLPEYETMVGALFIRLALWLEGHFELTLHSVENAEMNTLLFEIDRFIRQNLATVTSERLAEKFHFNKYYYNRFLLRMTGLNLVDYVQKIRLDTAVSLLLENSTPVKDVSQQVGYENRAYFYKLFREKYGMTPSEFRMEKASAQSPLQKEPWSLNPAEKQPNATESEKSATDCD